MSSINYIGGVVADLIKKHKTRCPYRLCRKMGVTIRYKDLGTDLKAYYASFARIRNIVVNNRVSEALRRILIAHELGHDQLHREIALLKNLIDTDIFDTNCSTEYEANIFAAELLIDDKELLEMLNDEDKSFFGVARELYVPAALLDFKFRTLKHKGYRIDAPYIANGDFLKSDVEGCFEADDL